LKNVGQYLIFYVLPFNLWCRKVDFSVDVEWHLTSHDRRCMWWGYGNKMLTGTAGANPYVEELIDTMPVVQAGLCKDFHSHLQVLYC